MYRITIQNLGNKTISSPAESVSALKTIQEAGLDWMHACGGKGRCTTCKMLVLAGAEHLSAPTPAEEKYRSENRLRPGERLSCQTCPTGDITIEVPPETRLPHLVYG